MKGLLVVAVAVGAAWVFFFQVLIPWIFDRPMFGFFKSRERIALEEAIAEANDEEEIEALRDKLYNIGRAPEDQVKRPSVGKRSWRHG